MYYYFLIILYIALFAILESVEIDRRLHYFGIFSIYLLLLFTAGFRFETGVDWKVYENVFKHVKPIFTIISDVKEGYYEKDMDIGYVSFCSAIKTLGGNNQLIFFLVSLFTLTNLIYCLKQYTPNVVIAVLIYYATFFFVLELSGIRQCIAVNIFFFAIRYIEAKNFIKYCFFIFIASCFHWSAFFLLPFYFILNKKFSSPFVILFFVGSLCVFFFQIRWLKTLLELFFPFISNKRFMEKALVYTSASAYATSREISLIVIVNIVIFVLMLTIMIKHKEQFSKIFKYFNIFFNLYFFNSFIYFCTSELIDISSRIQYYFLLSNVILFSYLIFLFKRKVERLAVCFFIIVYAIGISRGYLFESRDTIAYHPYQNYIIYNTFDLNSTGRMRLEMHKQIHIKGGFIED